MNDTIHYGSVTIIETTDGVDTIRETNYANRKPDHKKTVYREIIRDLDDKDILTHFLRLIDMQKAGAIDEIGLQCKRNEHTGQVRIEKTWTING